LESVGASVEGCVSVGVHSVPTASSGRLADQCPARRLPEKSRRTRRVTWCGGLMPTAAKVASEARDVAGSCVATATKALAESNARSRDSGYDSAVAAATNLGPLRAHQATSAKSRSACGESGLTMRLATSWSATVVASFQHECGGSSAMMEP
jgi:hypothetical protein